MSAGLMMVFFRHREVKRRAKKEEEENRKEMVSVLSIAETRGACVIATN